MTSPVDPQFSLAQVLRPPPNFREIYQGQPVTHPIAMPGTLDVLAGTPGYAPALLAGVPCPMGTTALFMFPVVYDRNTDNPVPYYYVIVWRVRNLADYNATRAAAFHLARQSAGAVDSRTPQSAQRVVIPAAIETVAFQSPASPGSPVAVNLQLAVQNVAGDGAFSPSTALPLSPIAGVLGEMQQGVADPVAIPQAVGPLFRTYQTMTKGDDFMVIVARDAQPGSNWDFDGPDLAFANYFSAMSGDAPHPPFEFCGVYALFGMGTRP